MKCSLEGCQGEYETLLIAHTVRINNEVVVIDHVPAEVCAECGDILFTPETVRHIERLLRERGQPTRRVALYEYAA